MRGIKKEDEKGEGSEKVSGEKVVKSRAMMLIPLSVAWWWKGKSKKERHMQITVSTFGRLFLSKTIMSGSIG